MAPAGNAAYRLHLAMLRAGLDSSVMTYRPYDGRYKVSSLDRGWKVLKSKVCTKLFQAQTSFTPQSYFFSQPPLMSKGISQCKQVREADVIYLHWICGGFIGYADIEELAKTGKTLIFFMHDMWTMTGGCHHSLDCINFKTGCHNCTMLSAHREIAAKHCLKKKQLFEKYSNIYFISPSEWLGKCARDSYVLKNKPVFVISNIVDETVFKQIPKELSRKILNLPLDKKIISFGCQAGISNPFKGWKYLQEAINLLDEENIHLLIYGSDYDETTAKQLSYPITFMGPVLDEYLLALINNSSDVFVSPSLAESFGLTFLENILCGTPVVGFNNTAVSEIVVTTKTGYLANNKSAEDLCKGLKYILKTPFNPLSNYYYSTEGILEAHKRIINQSLNK